LHGDNNIFDGRVLKSTDNTHMISLYEKMVKIAKDEKKVTPLDINSIEIEKRVRINNEIFFDDAFYRMVSKIAFEWYCAKNQVTDHLPEFDDIVKYIIDGEGARPVSIIQEKQIYEMFNQICNLGSHVLIGYESVTGQIEVIVWLMGLLAYRVVLSQSKLETCDNNFLFTELRTDSSRRELSYRNREEAMGIFENALNPKNMTQACEIGGIKIMIPRGMIAPLKNMDLYPMASNLVQYFESVKNDSMGPNELVNDIFLYQLKNSTQASSLHKKSIKRFVNDVFRAGHEPIVLNTKTSNKKATMLFYCVYLIGKMDEKLTDSSFQKLIKKEFASSEDIVVTDELEEQLKDTILSDNNYSTILEEGARAVNEWQ
jgi:hypothetical protein